MVTDYLLEERSIKDTFFFVALNKLIDSFFTFSFNLLNIFFVKEMKFFNFSFEFFNLSIFFRYSLFLLLFNLSNIVFKVFLLLIYETLFLLVFFRKIDCHLVHCIHLLFNTFQLKMQDLFLFYQLRFFLY